MSLPEIKMGREGQYPWKIGLEKVEEDDEHSYYIFLKRFMDLVGACFGLLFLLPIFLLIGIWIKLEDPKGKVLYKQTRIGKNGKPFIMYKFRSMVSNADELLESLIHLNETTGAMFKMKEDPRITRIGRFIRRTSIDELPQLWNVVKGNMSLVGPRPPLPREVEQYTRYDYQRLTVTPGCTGLWQVSARNSVGFKDMVELDLKYIRERSVWLDIKLICKTIWIMIESKNGY